METKLLRTIEEQSGLDRVARPYQRVLDAAVHRVPAVARVLHGRWLGHPLHPAATDIPVGAWATALVLDGAGVLRRDRAFRRASDLAVLFGLAGAAVSAVTGLADYTHTEGRARRTGFVHGVGNVVVTGLYVGSAIARRRGRRRLGVALSTTGFGLAIFTTWLGGQLTYQLGVGVREDERAEPERKRFPIAQEREARI